jgi:hypothetical protein
VNDRLVDFVCIRSTHRCEDGAALVSLHGGAMLWCPSGETVGHVWRAALGAPRPDERAVARAIAGRSHLAALPLRADN